MKIIKYTFRMADECVVALLWRILVPAQARNESIQSAMQSTTESKGPLFLSFQKQQQTKLKTNELFASIQEREEKQTNGHKVTNKRANFDR